MFVLFSPAPCWLGQRADRAAGARLWLPISAGKRRNMTSRAQAEAGVLALTLIALFVTASVVVEVVAHENVVALVRTAIHIALMLL